MIKRNKKLIFDINIYYNIAISLLLWQSIFCSKSIYAENISEVSGVVADGSTNTVIDRAINNVPIINIAPPNANGVSLNNFSDYNVTYENQIINNYKGLAVDTKLSGQIYGNPNFNQSGIDEAKIIINQITGNNRSNINGITEIAGRNADIIIANGNGIDIKGASYINTARLSFVTGIVNINKEGAIDNFAISNKQNADIAIDGVNNDNYNNLGLDASKVDYVDIITRSAKIAGDIYVNKELNFRLGNGNYDYNNKIISSNLNLGVANKPSFALDSSDLGGMYVGRIILAANENGVGVRVRGDINSNLDDIIFNVDGNIDYERLNSARNINLNSKNGKITQGLYHNSSRQAIANSKGDIILSANSGIDITNFVDLYAAQSIYLNSVNNIVKNSGKIRSDALLQNNGGIVINSNFFENNSNIFSSNNFKITSNNIVNNRYGSIESLKSMNINAGKFINSAIIKSGSDINIESSDDFSDNGQIKADGNLSIIANNGINYHNIYSGGNLSIINNNGDIKQSLQSYSLGSIDITNNNGNIYFGPLDGKSEDGNLQSIYAKNNINITAKGNIINNSKIYSEDNIAITAQNLVNRVSIISFNNKMPNNSPLANLNINLDNDLTNYGLILSSHNINLNVDGNIINDANDGVGEIFALKGDINISGKIYNTDFGNITKYDLFYLSFDKSSEIWEDLIANHYIDYNGNITDVFKDLGDSSLMIVKPSLAIYKKAIFDLINNLSVKIVKNGSGNNSIELIARNFDSSATDIYNYLLENRYIDSNGKILQKFYTDTNNIGGDGLIFGNNSDISFLRNDIYQLLQDARNGKIIENIFLDIGEINNKDLSSTLINQLRSKGYIDENGNVTKIFNDIKNADELDLTAEFSYCKQDIYNKINSTRLINKVSVGNFDHINYFANSTINNASQLYMQLQKEGFIDDDGNITDKFYINPIISKESPLIDYQDIISNILSNINQVTISDLSFRKISKSLDNSASRLFSHLITAGYLNSDGKKSNNFNFVNESDFANNFSFVASGGEYEKVRTSIWNKLIKENNDYIFQISDFLGQDFDSNILYDEKQILMNNLIKNGYLSNNGDIKQSFYNLSNNYDNFNLDHNFLGFRKQIIDLLSTISKTQSIITNQNFANIAQNSTKENAEQIFNQMLASSYIDSRGNFTQKLVDEVINYLGTDTEKSLQLKLGSLQNYASGVYQQIKAKNGITSIKNYNNKLENLNGASITSSFGDINIKSLAVNNIAKDNKNISLDPESAVNRTLHRSINWAWKGTVLWGYDTVFSTLDSNQSQIRAGHNINITADNILNNSSNILAGNNIEVKVGTLDNNRTQFVVSIPYIYETHWKKCKKLGGCDSGRYYNIYQNNILLQSNTPAIISAGNLLNISALSNILNDVPRIDNILNKSHPLQSDKDTSKPLYDNWQITIPTSSNGIFSKAPPESQYLITTIFDDNYSLTGSAYYKKRFGFDPALNQIKWLGDSFYQWDVINRQIIAATKKQQQWNELKWQDSFNKLIDNAFDQQISLNLVPGVKLTVQQINALKSDIIWYETEFIAKSDGIMQEVIVPHIYFAKNTINNIDLNNLGEQSMILASNINIKSNNIINNQGRIIANINPEQSTGLVGNIDLASSADIVNKSIIKSSNNININATGDVMNLSTSNNLITNHNGGTDIFSNIAKIAIIEGGNVNINTNKNFINISAKIIVSENNLGNDIKSNAGLTIIAGNNIDISNLQLRNRIEKSWGDKRSGGNEVNDKINNIASYINIAGDINMKTIGLSNNSNNADSSDINIIGSNINSMGNISLSAKDNINIISAIDNYYKMTNNYERKIMASSSSIDITNVIKNISSDLFAASNIDISSGRDINIISSNITGYNNGKINAGIYFDYNTISKTYGQNIINYDAKVNILNAKDVVNSYFQETKIKTKFANQDISSLKSIISGDIYSAKSALSNIITTNNASDIIKKDKIITDKGYKIETIVKSNINFTNNLSIASDADLIIRSSDLNTAQGDISLIGNNVNIIPDISSLVYYQYESNNGLFGSNKKRKFNNNTINNTSSIINAGTNLLPDIGNINIISNNNTNLWAAKLIANNNIDIIANNDLNILTAINYTKRSYINNDETTFNFTKGSSGYFDSEVINTAIIANKNSFKGDNGDNLLIDVGGDILAQYNLGNNQSSYFVRDSNGLITASNFATNPEIAYISSLDSNKTKYQFINQIVQNWDQTNRGLNENGQLAVATAAAAIAIGTGGIGVGISGAMLTAAAVSAGTTAAISGINASMNSNSNIKDSISHISSNMWKDTTSNESLRNIAIAAAIAGATNYAVEISGGTTNLDRGDKAVYKPNKDLLEKYPNKFPEYKGVIDPSYNNIGVANKVGNIDIVGQPVDYSKMTFSEKILNEGGIISENANKIGGMNSMSIMHDKWVSNVFFDTVPLANQITIIPAIAIEYCAIYPAICSAATITLINNNYGTET